MGRLACGHSTAFALTLFVVGRCIALADDTWATEPAGSAARSYASVAWPDPLNPVFVTLGKDRYLLSTTTGMQIWDARKNVFTDAKDWPAHSALRTAWARLGQGTLLTAASHNDKNEALSSVVWWNSATERFSAPLPLREGTLVQDLVSIDAQHALVCTRERSYRFDRPRGPGEPLPFAARIAGLRNGVLEWQTSSANALQAAILAGGIRGEVEGAGNIVELPAANAAPVIFNTRSCKWEATTLPDVLKGVSDATIKHYRLPDGRMVIGHADWHDPRRRSSAELSTPLLWDDAARRWVTLDNTAQKGTYAQTFKDFGVNDPIVSVASLGARFVEFLDVKTLRWVRSEQSLPETYRPAVAPLSTGQVIVFLRERGEILLVNRMQEAVSGRFLFEHSRFGEAKLRDGRIFVAGGGSEWHPNNRPEIVAPRTLKSTPIAPVPGQFGFASALELSDETVLVFGGLPPGCAPSSFGDPCGKHPPQPSYRYFPKEDRWELVPGLAINFDSGQFWDAGNSYIANQWPRNNALERGNRDFVYLESGNTRANRDTIEPLVTMLYRWRAGAAPERLAPLREGRAYATLLELADSRLVVIGGLVEDVNGMRFASTTEIFDEKRKRWVPGPKPNFAGGRAIKLANGRIFKFSTKSWGASSSYQAEVADAAFTRWRKAPEFPLVPFKVMDVVAVGKRVLVLPEEPYRSTVIWSDTTQTWSVSKPSSRKSPLAFTPLDERRALARSTDSFEIVPIPR